MPDFVFDETVHLFAQIVRNIKDQFNWQDRIEVFSFAARDSPIMIEIKKAFQNLTPEEFSQLLDSPVWIALAAAYAGDGHVGEHEKAEAIKLAHLRRFTAPKSLREFYELVDTQFAQRFYILDMRLPSRLKDKEIYLEQQLKRVHDIMTKLDPDVTSSMEESLESFYEHVFNSHKSFFQYFALPIISNRLDKKAGHYRFSDDK